MGNNDEFSIESRCPACGVGVSVRQEDGGALADCPKCGEEFTIEKVADWKPKQAASHAPKQSDSSDGWKSFARWLLLLSAIGVGKYWADGDFGDKDNQQILRPGDQHAAAAAEKGKKDTKYDPVRLVEEIMEKRKSEPKAPKPPVSFQADTKELNVVPIPNIDFSPVADPNRTFFYISALEELIQGFDVSDLDRESQIQLLNESVKTGDQYLGAVTDAKLDQRIVSGYHAMSMFRRSWRDAMFEIYEIDEALKTQASGEKMETMGSSLGHATSAFQIAHKYSSPDDANAFAALAALGVGLFSHHSQSAQQEERLEGERDTQHRRILEKVYLDQNTLRNACEKIARHFEHENGLNRGALGFVLSAAEINQISNLVAAGNFAGAVAAFHPSAKLQTHNPLARFTVTLLSIQGLTSNEAKPEVYDRYGKKLIALSRQVPADAACEADRLMMLGFAAECFTTAALIEAKNTYSTGSRYSGAAVAVLNRLSQSSDTTGAIRFYLSQAKALSRRYDEAAQLALEIEPLFLNNAGFHFHTASCLSLAGRYLEALGQLGKAVKAGIGPISAIRADADIKGLYAHHRSEIDQLLSLRLKWKIYHGIGDDVVIWNDSSYDLTNVTLKIDVETPKGSDSHERKLDRISAGEKLELPDVLFITGKTVKSRTLSVTCDQGSATFR